MIGKLVPTTVLGLLLSEALLVGTAYVAAAYLISDIDPVVWLLYEDGLLRIGVLVAGILAAMYLLDMYERFWITSKFFLFQQICLVLGAGFLLQALLSYGLTGLGLPRWIMMTGSMICLIVIPAWRVLYGAVLVQAVAAERLLFLGASAAAQEIAKRIAERPELGLSVIGFVADVPDGQTISGAPVLGPVACFRQIVEECKPDRMIVGMTERRQRMPVYDLLEIHLSGVTVEDAASAYELVLGRISTQHLRPSQLIFSRELGPRPGTVRLQTLYSLLLAAAGLVLTAPLMLLVAVLVRLTSNGPVLYRQKRVGRNGQVFTLYKFRSMRSDAETTKGAVWAAEDDPRVTGLGRWLRRFRMDELPQLFNVLKGDMSLVGPRPERPEFVTALSEKIPFYRHRHCIKPGITGWAQINYKYSDTLEDSIIKLEYDLYYIKNLSPMLDFYILFHTLKVMLLSRGAR